MGTCIKQLKLIVKNEDRVGAFREGRSLLINKQLQYNSLNKISLLQP